MIVEISIILVIVLIIIVVGCCLYMGVDPLTGVAIILGSLMAMFFALVGGMIWAAHREAKAMTPEQREKMMKEFIEKMSDANRE